MCILHRRIAFLPSRTHGSFRERLICSWLANSPSEGFAIISGDFYVMASFVWAILTYALSNLLWEQAHSKNIRKILIWTFHYEAVVANLWDGLFSSGPEIFFHIFYPMHYLLDFLLIKANSLKTYTNSLF